MRGAHDTTMTTERITVNLREPTPGRLNALAMTLGVSVEELFEGDVPDPTPTQTEKLLAILCEDHHRFTPRTWPAERRNAILGSLLARFCVESCLP